MNKKLPVTRYYGSKRKLLPWIWQCIESENLPFNSVLDLFGGSGVFSYSAKVRAKEVFYNDLFKFNYRIGQALIENSKAKISNDIIDYLLSTNSSISYKYHIAEKYSDIYYTDDENQQIDIICQNIQSLDDNMLKSLSYYLLIQSCLIKRPFNLFHRKNLYLRLNNVDRTFGNKKTWEISFKDLFKRFADEINSLVFDNYEKNKSYNYSALVCPIKADLVYIDPPYINSRGSHVSYHSKYHFLEALVNYQTFSEHIDYNKKNLVVQLNNNTDFETPKTFFSNLQKIIEKHNDSFIVLSYRKNGTPSIDELKGYINSIGREYSLYTSQYSYALHRNNGAQEEALFIIK